MRMCMFFIVALYLTQCTDTPAFSIAQTEPGSCDGGSGADGQADGQVNGADSGSACSGDAVHAPISVHVVGLRNSTGKVFIALFGSASGFIANEALRGGTTPIVGSSATLTFHGVPPGSYGVSIFHDENQNGKLDTNAIGIPTEGFGFSRDAMGSFGPPTFEQIRFDHSDSAASPELVLHAKYF